ncbi:MAG TPA: SDR family oxidoreductase, partial [Patescibacteria group bacterium]|nr:SDR family oxidoreductase [Patescibacteria group bacterium]
AFRAEGAKVIVTDINGGDLKLDVTDKNSIDGAVKKIIADQGQIDVWINNHGATGKQAVTDWNQIIKVNLTGTYLCCLAAAEVMREGGSIINLASIYGLVGPDFSLYPKAEYAGKPMGVPAAYSASKGGVISLTRHLASQFADKKIRVNCVTPGGIFDKQSNDFVKAYSAKVPLSRMANRNEISGALLYLASDLSSYVTGTNIIVDGGLTARA